MGDEEHVQDALESLTVEAGASTIADNGTQVKKEGGDSTSPDESKSSRTRSPSMSPDDRKTPSDSVSTPDVGQRPKLSRKASQKMAPRPIVTFLDVEDSTAEACTLFQVLTECVYGSKTIGSSEHDTLDCDCNEEWRRSPSNLHAEPVAGQEQMLMYFIRRWHQPRLW